MPRKPTLIVYGATAFTAKALLPYLDNHPDAKDFDFILAGRNRSKLDAVNSELTTRREVIALDLADEEGVRRLVEKGDVVVNLAGPFKKHNAEALIKVCAETGKHYVDVSAETTWLASTIIPRYDYQASKTGACIVPSCGFDSIPSDLTLYHALRHLQLLKPSAAIKRSTSFFRLQGSFSGGTLQTAKGWAEEPRAERRWNEWALVSGVSQKHQSPPPQLVYSLQCASFPQSLVGSYFFMYPYNRCIIRRSWSLSRLAPASFLPSDTDHKDGQEPIHGGEMVYNEAMQYPNPFKAGLISSILFGFLGLFFASSLFRKLITWLLPAGSGSSLEELKKGSLKVTNISTSDTIPRIEVLTTLYGEGDPGYLNTCYTLAEAALSLILPPPEGTCRPPLGQVGGVLTPSTAMGMVLVERLRRSGKLTIHSEVVEDNVRLEEKKTL